MPAYLFIKTRITDPAQYQKYVEAVRPLAARHGSRYVIRSRPVEVLEGSPDAWATTCCPSRSSRRSRQPARSGDRVTTRRSGSCGRVLAKSTWPSRKSFRCRRAVPREAYGVSKGSGFGGTLLSASVRAPPRG